MFKRKITDQKIDDNAIENTSKGQVEFINETFALKIMQCFNRLKNVKIIIFEFEFQQFQFIGYFEFDLQQKEHNAWASK